MRAAPLWRDQRLRLRGVAEWAAQVASAAAASAGAAATSCRLYRCVSIGLRARWTNPTTSARGDCRSCRSATGGSFVRRSIGGREAGELIGIVSRRICAASSLGDGQSARTRGKDELADRRPAPVRACPAVVRSSEAPCQVSSTVDTFTPAPRGSPVGQQSNVCNHYTQTMHWHTATHI